MWNTYFIKQFDIDIIDYISNYNYIKLIDINSFTFLWFDKFETTEGLSLLLLRYLITRDSITASLYKEEKTIFTKIKRNILKLEKEYKEDISMGNYWKHRNRIVFEIYEDLI